jgi:uncharacterized protein YciI
MRFSYFYFMKEDPERVRAVAPQHVAHWRGLGLREYVGGPFADKSGGLITFEAPSVEAAERHVGNDPFVRRTPRESLGQRVAGRVSRWRSANGELEPGWVP